jgi:hypothetical protein
MIGARKPVLRNSTDEQREDEVDHSAAGGEVPRTSVEPTEPETGKVKLPPYPPTRREFSLGQRGPDGYYGSGW